jgi:LPS sulfotransferase NodH
MNETSPKERFMIITTARSGSNQLVDYVNQTKVALCFGEIVKKQFFDAPGSSKHFNLISACFPNVEEAKTLQLSNPEEFWEIVSNRVPGKHRYVGAKVFYEHREKHPLWREILKRNSIIIHLWRSRVFDSFLSLDRAKATKQWTIRQGSAPTTRNPPIVFDEKRYLAYRDLSRDRFMRMRNRRNESAHYYEIEYAQIGEPALIGSILNDIFKAQAVYSETLMKQAPDDPLDNVQNRSVAEKYLNDRLDN